MWWCHAACSMRTLPSARPSRPPWRARRRSTTPPTTCCTSRRRAAPALSAALCTTCCAPRVHVRARKQHTALQTGAACLARRGLRGCGCAQDPLQSALASVPQIMMWCAVHAWPCFLRAGRPACRRPKRHMRHYLVMPKSFSDGLWCNLCCWGFAYAHARQGQSIIVNHSWHVTACRDDHDIFDGWGSYAPAVQAAPVMQGVYGVSSAAAPACRARRACACSGQRPQAPPVAAVC